MGKAPLANTAALQAASLLGNPTAKSRKPGLQPVQDVRLSQAVPPTQAEETSDSSSSSDSNEEETPKQTPKPGQFCQEDALSAAGQARVGAAFCCPVGGVSLSHSGWRGVPPLQLGRALLSLEAEGLSVAVTVLGR